MGIIIGSARCDEHGKISGGTPGDQTGKEVATQAFYMHKKGWYALRAKDVNIANKLAQAMLDACNNSHLGYDQSNRYGIITNLRKYGSIAAISINTECDCSATVRACIIQATGKDPGDFNTSNEVSVILRTGLFDKVNVISADSVYNGDILVTKVKAHTVIVTSGRARTNTSTPSQSQPKAPSQPSQNQSNQNIKLGQQHAINFTGVNITVDGRVGAETNLMKARVLQHAMNLDYKSNQIQEDGKFGSASKKKLGSHYVKKGEKQYMVTAAEILMYLNGISPNGVENPGQYGNGLVTAAKQKFGGSGTMISASQFLALL